MTTIARADWVDEDGVGHKNDIYLHGTQFAMSSGKEAYAQILESVIKTVKGELLLNRGFGIPYFRTVFNDNFHLESWAVAVREMVLSLDFIEAIDTFEYEYDFHKRKLTYVLKVTTTDDGQVEVSEE